MLSSTRGAFALGLISPLKWAILHVLCFPLSLVKTSIIPGPFEPWRLFLPASFRLVFPWLQVASSLACSDTYSEDSEREDLLQIFRAFSLCNFLFYFTLPCELQILWSPPSQVCLFNSGSPGFHHPVLGLKTLSTMLGDHRTQFIVSPLSEISVLHFLLSNIWKLFFFLLF